VHCGRSGAAAVVPVALRRPVIRPERRAAPV